METVGLFEGRVGGIEKMTLLDYPNRISAIIFYNGCNLSCCYCYNPSLVCPNGKPEILPAKEIVDFLCLRKGVLDGIVFSGGECTIWGDKLEEDLRFTKSLGYLIKIDTNGQNPGIIRHFIEEKLVDYVALDIKCPKRLETRFKANMDLSYQTMNILQETGTKFETRTTIHPDITNEDDISEMMGELVEHGLNQVHYFQYFFEGTDTIEPVNQHPRYFDLNKVDSHRLVIAERNKIANEKRQSYTKID